MIIRTFATAERSSVSSTTVLRHAADAARARQPRLKVVGLRFALASRHTRAVLHPTNVVFGDAAAERGVVAAAVEHAAGRITVVRQRAEAVRGLALGGVGYAHRAAGRR